MTVVEYLTAARDTIAERGWCQYTLVDTQNRVCARGAMIGAFRVAGDSDLIHAVAPEVCKGVDPAACAILAEVIREQYPEGVGQCKYDYDHGIVVSFNNSVGRTADEVLAVFDKAILRAGDLADGTD